MKHIMNRKTQNLEKIIIFIVSKRVLTERLKYFNVKIFCEIFEPLTGIRICSYAIVQLCGSYGVF